MAIWQYTTMVKWGRLLRQVYITPTSPVYITLASVDSQTEALSYSARRAGYYGLAGELRSNQPGQTTTQQLSEVTERTAASLRAANASYYWVHTSYENDSCIGALMRAKI